MAFYKTEKGYYKLSSSAPQPPNTTIIDESEVPDIVKSLPIKIDFTLPEEIPVKGEILEDGN